MVIQHKINELLRVAFFLTFLQRFDVISSIFFFYNSRNNAELILNHIHN